MSSTVQLVSIGNDSKRKFRQLIVTLVSQLSITAAAISFVWIEPISDYFSTELKFSGDTLSWLISVVEVGCIAAPIPCGLLADKFGRKPVLFSVGPILIISWTMILMSSNLYILCTARVLQGIGIGVSFTVAPMYVAEISEAQNRGELSGYLQTMWYIGVLFVYILGITLTYQFYILICLTVPLLLSITFYFLPESPYYYLMKNENDKAGESLKILRPQHDTKQELESLQNSVNEEMLNKGSFRDLFKTKNDVISFMIVQALTLARYLTGIATLINYSGQMFSESSGIEIPKEYMSIALGFLLLIIAIFAARASDKFGRRKLLIVSCGGCIFSHLSIGIYFYLINIGLNPITYSPFLHAGILGFVFFTDIGLGPIIQTIQAEMFASNVRAIGGGVTQTIAAIASFISLKTFQPISDNYGMQTNFWIYSIISFIGTIIIYKFVPETANKTLGEISVEIKKNNTIKGL